MKSSNKKQSGFSLIELLVVIVIIGILAVIVMINNQRSKLQARDARRVADIREIFNSLQVYYTNTESFPLDCSTVGYQGGCDALNTPVVNVPVDTTTDNLFLEFLRPTFMGSAPRDPINDAEHNYVYATDVEYPTGSGQFYLFIVGGRLEDVVNREGGIESAVGFEDYYFLGEKAQ